MQITDVQMIINNVGFMEDDGVAESGIDVGWISPYGGFGRCVLTVDENGKIEIDNEHMDKSHFLEVMSALYDMADVI